MDPFDRVRAPTSFQLILVNQPLGGNSNNAETSERGGLAAD